MGKKALNIAVTIDKFINSYSKTTDNSNQYNNLLLIVSSISEQIAKDIDSLNEAEYLFSKLKNLIIECRDRELLTSQQFEALNTKINQYLMIYRGSENSQDYVIKFLRSYLYFKNHSPVDDKRNETFYRKFVLDSRSIDILPTLKLIVDILNLLKSSACKDVIEYRIGKIIFADTINRQDANYADYLRLMEIAKILGWYDEDSVEVFKERCKEMSKCYTDENGIPMGFKGNKYLDEMVKVEVTPKEYLDVKNTKANYMTDNFNYKNNTLS